MFNLQQCREQAVVGMIAVCVGLTVYTALGLAWSFKIAVETPGKLFHHVARRSVGNASLLFGPPERYISKTQPDVWRLA